MIRLWLPVKMKSSSTALSELFACEVILRMYTWSVTREAFFRNGKLYVSAAHSICWMLWDNFSPFFKANRQAGEVATCDHVSAADNLACPFFSLQPVRGGEGVERILWVSSHSFCMCCGYPLCKTRQKVPILFKTIALERVRAVVFYILRL